MHSRCAVVTAKFNMYSEIDVCLVDVPCHDSVPQRSQRCPGISEHGLGMVGAHRLQLGTVACQWVDPHQHWLDESNLPHVTSPKRLITPKNNFASCMQLGLAPIWGDFG